MTQQLRSNPSRSDMIVVIATKLWKSGRYTEQQVLDEIKALIAKGDMAIAEKFNQVFN